MDNRKKVWRQFAINAVIAIVSVGVIYVSQMVRFGKNVGLLDGLNAELVVVIMTSLGAVVGWRVVEEIKLNFYYNLFLVVMALAFVVEYFMAMIYEDSEMIKMCILYFGVVPFFGLYGFEQSRLLRHAKRMDIKNRSDALKYRGKK